MSDQINLDRRRFFGTAAMTLAAAQVMTGSAGAQSSDAKPAGATAIKPGTILRSAP